MVEREDDSIVDSEAAPKRRFFNRKRSIIVVVAIVLVITAVALLYWIHPYTFWRDVGYDYSISISTNSTAPFKVICPMPIDGRGDPYPNMIAQLVVSGQATIVRNDTPYGPALEVSSWGAITVKWKADWQLTSDWREAYLVDYNDLSMQQSQSHGWNSSTWVYSDDSEIHFTLDYHYGNTYGNVGGDYISFKMDDYLSSGWNTVALTQYHMVS